MGGNTQEFVERHVDRNWKERRRRPTEESSQSCDRGAYICALVLAGILNFS